MNKTGESHATAARSLREAIRPALPPPHRSSEWFDADGCRIEEVEALPEVELVNIRGDFDAEDLSKAWVPETAFHDPMMNRDRSWPKDVKRVLTLAEYIAARTAQTGWRLQRVEPNPAKFMGKTLIVLLHWSAGRRHPEKPR